MNKLPRLFRHLVTTRATGRRAFPESALHAIQNAIAAGEKLHRAEVCCIIEPSLSIAEILEGETSRERARELFALHRIWDTEENCGVLVYINLADHQVEIVADRNVGRALSAGDWETVCKTMTKGFAAGRYEESTLAALKELNELLHVHFPDQGGSVNELSNRPLIV